MAKLKNVEIGAALQAVTTLQSVDRPSMVGVRLRRLARELRQAYQDVEEERIAALKKCAELDPETGELVLDEQGNARFLSPSDERDFGAEMRVLYAGEVEISETLTLADLVRRVRDEHGRVYELDDVPGTVIEQLGDLLQDSEP